MALLRQSEKQLAARRANAKKSTGPRTPEGKVRTAQNACKHHLYARTHTIPPEWQDRIIPRVVEATAEFADDPSHRDLIARWLYLELWAVELDTLADLYFNDILARCNDDFPQAFRLWYRQSTLQRVIHKRRMNIHYQVIKAHRDLRRYKPAPALSHHLPKTRAVGQTASENPPSTVRTCISHKTNHMQSAPPAPPVPVHDEKVPTPITLQVNGAPRSATAPDGITLLDFLRDHLHLTGAKYGCGEGACGACTVLIDNRPVQACTLSAASVQNRQITTIEGLAQRGKLHPVQQAFLDTEAFQCGYCTPAMILAAAALLKESFNPSPALIREKLEGHLCRCGSYPRIVEAVRLAAKLEAAHA